MMNNELITTDQFDFSAIENSNLSPRTIYRYKHVLQAYLDTGAQLGNYQALQEYAQGLCKSNQAFLKSAIRMVSIEYELLIKGSATPENIGEIQASVYRLEAMNSAIKLSPQRGELVHIWLKNAQVKKINESLLRYRSPKFTRLGDPGSAGRRWLTP